MSIIATHHFLLSLCCYLVGNAFHDLHIIRDECVIVIRQLLPFCFRYRFQNYYSFDLHFCKMNATLTDLNSGKVKGNKQLIYFTCTTTEKPTRSLISGSHIGVTVFVHFVNCLTKMAAVCDNGCHT